MYHRVIHAVAEAAMIRSYKDKTTAEVAATAKAPKGFQPTLPSERSTSSTSCMRLLNWMT
jgi:hypothetical protein